jgi:hypothetical protein
MIGETDMALDYRGVGQYGLVFNELATAARYRGTVTYQELAHLIGLEISGNYMANELGKILEQISRAEHEMKHPILSAIVVNVDGVPGEGFWGIAKNLGKFNGTTEDERRQFWETEKKAVHDHWRKKF